MYETPKTTVEFEDGWSVTVSFDGTWHMINTSGCKVARLETEEIVEIMDKLGLKIVAKSD